MMSDLRFALRSFAKSPSFAFIAVATLAVGIGAAVTMFSALRAIVVEPFAYPDQDQVVQVWPGEDHAMSPPDFFDLREQASFFKELGVYTPNQANIGGEKILAVEGANCTSGVLRSFGVVPALGRWLEPADEEKGAPAVAVISDGLWHQLFAGDPGVVGRRVPVDGVDTTIVGIMPSGFEFASPWYRSKTCKIWSAMKIRPGDGDRGNGWLSCVGRLKEGITVASANAQIKSIGARLAAAYPETNTNKIFLVRSLKVEMTRYAAPYLWMLFGAVIMVLLVACANVASMLLARNAMRQGEFGVRIALGASRVQIIRLVMVESIVLALTGSVAGILVASFGVRALALAAETTDTRRAAMTIDGGVLVFAVAAMVASALLAGLPPAFATFNISVADAARADSRSVAGSHKRQRLLRGVVISQVAIAFILANLAALFSFSYLKVVRANKPLETNQVLSAEIDLHGGKYATVEQRTRFAEQLAEQAASLPGVTASGITSKLPLEGGSNMNVLVNDEIFDPKVEGTLAEVSSVTPNYFSAAGIKLLRGRTLQSSDSGQDAIGVVINHTLAEKCWPGVDPIGKIVRSNSSKSFFHARVVGVVEDVRQWGAKSDPNPEIYWTMDRNWGQTIFLVVRSSQPASLLAPQVKDAVAGMDRDMPISRVRTLRDIVFEATRGDRAVLGVVDVFMATALGLVAVGLYGTLSYCMQRRTREIGIRMAVGAERGSILGLVFRQGFTWVVIGLILGSAASLALATLLRAMVWGVDPFSLPSLAGSGVVVALTAVLACWLPAWRTSRVYPIVALRAE